MRSLVEKDKKDLEGLLTQIREISMEMRHIIVGLPPKSLLAYIYSTPIRRLLVDDSDETSISTFETIDSLLLEFVHASWVAEAPKSSGELDETKVKRLYEYTEQIESLVGQYLLFSSHEESEFDQLSGEINFALLSRWFLLRGHRYSLLEGEFYNYALQPHSDALMEVYGINSAQLAEAIQTISTRLIYGQIQGLEFILSKNHEVASECFKVGIPLEDGLQKWFKQNPKESLKLDQSIADVLLGEITNVSRHTDLPELLLEDFAYKCGEDDSFYMEGEFAGTPLSTLPIRKKPLLKIGSDYHVIDPNFFRDSAYQLVLFNLLRRKPEYEETFRNKQKEFTENAFVEIFKNQLAGAEVFNEVYYRDRNHKQPFENDTLILLDDTIILVEAKSGAQASIASPAVNFKKHRSSIKDLIVSAYDQCNRFFNYLNSADEVPIFQKVDGKLVEVKRINLSKYRQIIPVGLTIETLSPFSCTCKAFSNVEPILGKHAFISLSIDDLLVLTRFLKTTGELIHYLEVRQAMGNLKQIMMFDEMEHLGAYITKNRFDLSILDSLKGEFFNQVVSSGTDEIVDKYFADPNFDQNDIPSQKYPPNVQKLLQVLERTKSLNWLGINSFIRNLADEVRDQLDMLLSKSCRRLFQIPYLSFGFTGRDENLFIWVQRNDFRIETKRLHEKAQAFALAVDSVKVKVVLLSFDPKGEYTSAICFSVTQPQYKTEENKHIFEDAEEMRARRTNFYRGAKSNSSCKVKVGKNDPCPCGSGLKFKKCCGRK